MIDYSKDEYRRFVEDREALEARAREVFDIRAKYLPQGDYVESFEFANDYIEVSSYTYCCGEQSYDHCSFPFEYLAKSDEELHQLFQQEKAQREEEQRKREAESKAKEKQQQREWESKQLVQLLNKFIAEQRPLPEEFNDAIHKNFWKLVEGTNDVK